MNEREIFIDALQKGSPEERTVFLDEACAGNSQLRRRIEELLRAEAELGAFLEPPNPEPRSTIISPETEGPGSRIGPYKLLQQLGEGGMGVVYMAEQVEPVVRRVALKIIKPGTDTRQVIARFEAERQALALMDHPCIAKVYDAGATASGRPYFVMELVKGVPITKFCDREQLPVSKRLELFERVCQAVQHAHQKGIIHRDIKPTNILVALHDGEPVPMVIDFGLAKATGQKLTEKTLFTEFGQIVGTLEYMSPEQAELNQLDIDTRTDIYSLGAVLYELLTGVPPLERSRLRSAAFDEMLRIIREEEPKKPSTRLSTLQQAELTAVSQQRGVEGRKLPTLFRGELDWIVMKALDKNRTRRYETANGLARDVQRFLADEPVEARPPSAMYRLQKFAERHMVGTAAAAAGFLVLVAAITGLTVSNRLIATAQERTEAALQDAQLLEAQATASAAVAQQQRDEKAAQLYTAQMQIAKQEWEENHASRARQILDSYLPQSNGGVDLRGWEWHYLWRLTHGELNKIPHQIAPIAIVYAPDGKSLVTGHADGIIRFWNPEGTDELRSWRAHVNETHPHNSRVQKLAVSADGRMIATAGTENVVKLWDIATGAMVRSFPSRGGLWYGIAMDANGTRLAVQSGERGSNDITIYETATGNILRNLKGESLQLAMSADGRRLTSVGGPTPGGIKVQQWNLDTGEELKNIETNHQAQTAVAISPDGRIIVAGDIVGGVGFWDADSGAQMNWKQAHNNRVERIVFSSDGRRVASASSDSTICVWDVDQREVLRRHRGHDECLDVAFAPKSDVLATCGWDQVVRFWDTAGSEEAFARREHWFLDRVDFSPDGRFYAVANNTNLAVYDTASQVKLWSAVAMMRPDTDNRAQVLTSPLAFDAKNRWIATGHSSEGSGSVQFRDLSSGRLIQETKVHSQNLGTLLPFPDGRMATGCAGGEIAIWSEDGRRVTTRIQTQRVGVSALAVNSDGRLLASGSGEPEPTIELWNTADGSKIRSFDRVAGAVYAIVFSHDGRFLFTGDKSGYLRTWDVHTGKQVRECRSSCNTLAISFDGKRIATTGEDHTVKLWDTATSTEILTLKCELGRRRGAAFSPDGWKLAAGGGQGGDIVWDARPLTPDVRIEIAAEKLVRELHSAHSDRKKMLAAIEAESSISNGVRQRALELTTRLPDQDRATDRDELLESASRMEERIRAGSWVDAVPLARKIANAQPEDDFFQYTFAALLARAGDVSSYEVHCQKLLDKHAKTDDPIWAERTAKACLILPATGERLMRASELAEQALRSGQNHGFLPYFYTAAALAAYRRADFQKCIDLCDSALDEEDSVKTGNNSRQVIDDPYRDSQTLFAKAMSLQRLGKLGDADQAREKANGLMKQMNGVDPKKIGWHDRAIAEMLQKECQQVLFEGPATSPTPKSAK